MLGRTRIAPNILHLLCIAVLVLSGCGGDDTDQAGPVVTTAELFAGNPIYGGSVLDQAVEGQGLRDDPPLRWGSLLFVGDKLLTYTQQEIWYTDLTGPKPVIQRLAGRENTIDRNAPSPGICPNARFVIIQGIAVKSDGSIVGANVPALGDDPPRSLIFEVKDPFGPNCTVTFLAGSATLGDIDGPGASAQLGLPGWPVVIGDNIYFIDEQDSVQHNSKLKRVANDVGNTVTTIAPLPVGRYSDMIASHGKLYVLRTNLFIEDFILEIDPATGAMRDIIRTDDQTFGDHNSSIQGLATDENGFFTFHRRQLFYVTLDGKVKTLAGRLDPATVLPFDFSPSYDPTRPQTAESVELINRGKVFLAFRDRAVYFSALGPSGNYVERLAIK